MIQPWQESHGDEYHEEAIRQFNLTGVCQECEENATCTYCGMIPDCEICGGCEQGCDDFTCQL